MMSSTGIVGKERSVDFGRSTLLLIGSFAIAWNTTTAVHELGHLFADRWYGIDAAIVLEPFRASYTSIADSSLTHSAWLDGAGPLGNLIVGALVTGAVWRLARPAVLPLLLWGPLALLQESTNALVQVATSEPGTDWARIVEAGFPTPLIWVAGVLALIGGFALLIGVVPATGVSTDWMLSRRIGVLGVGFGAYPAVAVLVSVLAGYESDDVARNLRLLAFILLVAVAAALVSRRSRSELRDVDVAMTVVARTLTIAGALVVTLLLV